MIASAHHKIEYQHFFSFSLDSFVINSCFLEDFSSDVGQDALKKVLYVASEPSYSDHFLSADEVSRLSRREIGILQNLNSCFINNIYYKIALDQKKYDEIFKFLQTAKKIRPFICRAAFMASDVN